MLYQLSYARVELESTEALPEGPLRKASFLALRLALESR
jgi:hypothetical protein